MGNVALNLIKPDGSEVQATADTNGNLAVAAAVGAATVPTATTLQNAAVANGNGTNLAVAGYATALLQIVASPAMSGGTTVNFEGSADGGTTWVSVVAHLLGTAASQVTTTTSNGDYRINCAGLSHLRARISGYSAGTVTVTGYASPLAGSGTAVAVSNLVQPAALGQAAMAASTPVVIASDQSAVPVTATGNVAHAATDSGNPVKVGGVYRATAPTLTDGQRADLLLGSRNALSVSAGAGGASSDAQSNTIGWLTDSTATNRPLGIAQHSYNGLTWDRHRVSNVFKNLALTAATAETTAWTPAGGKKFRAIRLILTASAQTVLTFKDNTSGTTIFTVELAANAPFTIELGPNGILSAAANNVLTVTRATSAILNGTIEGTEE